MKRARIVVFGIFISLGVAFSLASNIYAADVWHNDAEKETYNNAHSGYGIPSEACQGSFGAIWATGSVNDRYTMSLSVNADTSSVPIYIRGSSYLCPGTSGMQIYAIRISSNGGLPFSNLSKTTLDRGTPVSGAFSNRGGLDYITATLDISSVPKTPGSYNREIKIYRCASNDGITLTGNGANVCGTQTVKITIIRNYDYELVPKVTTNVGGNSSIIRKEPGEKIVVSPAVTNSKGAYTQDTKWKLSYFEIASENSSISTSRIDNTNSDTCATYDSAVSGESISSSCQVKAEGSGRKFNNSGDNQFTSSEVSDAIKNFVIPQDAELGTRFCFALSISPYKVPKSESWNDQNNKGNQWRHSSAVCIQVVRKPKMQVWGLEFGQMVVSKLAPVGWLKILLAAGQSMS